MFYYFSGRVLWGIIEITKIFYYFSGRVGKFPSGFPPVRWSCPVADLVHRPVNSVSITNSLTDWLTDLLTDFVSTQSSDRSFMVDPLSYFSFQPVCHDWSNKGHGMCYPVCGMMHIKEPLLLIGKSSPCGGSGFPLSLSEWFLTICPTPYNRK